MLVSGRTGVRRPTVIARGGASPEIPMGGECGTGVA